MKTAVELLISAPDDQVGRCRMALRAIAAGDWESAEFSLRNASCEATGDWSKDACELADYCHKMCCKTLQMQSQ